MSDQEEVRLGPIRRHPQVCHGNLTFAGSRVWVDSLFGYLKEGAPLDEWLEDFPSVSRGQAQATLELALEVLETISAVVPAVICRSAASAETKHSEYLAQMFVCDTGPRCSKRLFGARRLVG